MSMTVNNFQGNITTDYWRRPNKKLFVQHHYQIQLPNGSVVARIRNAGVVGTQHINAKKKIKAHWITKGGKSTVAEQGVRLQKIQAKILHSENVDAGKANKNKVHYLALAPKDGSRVIKAATPKASAPAVKAEPVLPRIEQLNNSVANLTARVQELEKRLAAETASKKAILAELKDTKELLQLVKDLLINQ